MCHIKSTCPMYIEYSKTGKMSNMCKNCTYLQRAERVSAYAKVGLVLAIIAFLVSTYILF